MVLQEYDYDNGLASGWPDPNTGPGTDDPLPLVPSPAAPQGGSYPDVSTGEGSVAAPVPLPASVQTPTPQDNSSLVGDSGYDYTNWTWELGQRPPSNQDWTKFTDEQRRRILGGTSIENAREAWQERWQAGGDLYQGGGGKAGAGGVGAGGAGVKAAATAGGPGSDWFAQSIRDLYNNVPYNKAAIDKQKALLKSTSAGTAAAAKDSLGRDLVRRGLSRSAFGADKVADIQQASDTAYSQNVTGILVKAVEANYAAKQQALQMEYQRLQLQQQAALAAAKNQLDRDIANANVALGYARIQAEAANLQSSLSSAYQLASLNNNEALIRLLISSGLDQTQIQQILKDQGAG